MSFPRIDKDTQVCISIAQRPSRFGTTVHNAAYQALGLNFIYKAFAVSDLKGAVAAVRALGIRGCSVTMPFKERALKFVDALDQTARSVGALNTIVNSGGKLKGYNTDVMGAVCALTRLGIRPRDTVLVLGAGGAAKAIVYALESLGAKKVFLSNRTASRAKKAAERFGIRTLAWPKRNEFKPDILINATSIGMSPQAHAMPVEESVVLCCRAVMDVIVTPIESRLIQTARRHGKKVVPGYEMSLGQAMAQFELYTSNPAPAAVMRRAVLKLLKE